MIKKRIVPDSKKTLSDQRWFPAQPMPFLLLQAGTITACMQSCAIFHALNAHLNT